MPDILHIVSQVILAKCENRQDDLLRWTEQLINHEHRGPAKEVLLDTVVEALGTDPEYYRDFIIALEEEVRS